MYGFQRTLSLVEAYRVNGLSASPTRSTAKGWIRRASPTVLSFFNSWDDVAVDKPKTDQQNIKA